MLVPTEALMKLELGTNHQLVCHITALPVQGKSILQFLFPCIYCGMNTHSNLNLLALES